VDGAFKDRDDRTLSGEWGKGEYAQAAINMAFGDYNRPAVAAVRVFV